jgi:hypothetical protein
MKTYETIMKNKVVKISIIILTAMVFLYLVYIITYDIAYNHTISNYLNNTGK